jgi:cytochrome c-type biogenesis protein CcmH/NrfG
MLRPFAPCLLCAALLLSAVPASAASLAEVQSLLEARAPTALAAAEALVKAEPKNGGAWVALTRARVYARRSEKAVEAGERATELSPMRLPSAMRSSAR